MDIRKEILKLAQEEDINKLSLREIAVKIGIQNLSSPNRIKYHINRLMEEGKLVKVDSQIYNREVADLSNVSDGYHTFKELYEFRRLYNTALFNEWAKQGLYDVHKSRKHSDGKFPFDNFHWFIVVAELPTGQISNHYTLEHWNEFKVPERELANEYDGHSSQDVEIRLQKYLKD